MRIARGLADGETIWLAAPSETPPDEVADPGYRWRRIADPFAGDGRAPVEGLGQAPPVSRLLAPVTPTVVLGAAHNAGPEGRALPPQVFHKSVRSVVGPGDEIVLPAGIGTVGAEGEVALVVGRTCKDLTVDEAAGALRGVTIVDDVTAIDQIPVDSLWTQVKSRDTFTPVGPWIETSFDPALLTTGAWSITGSIGGDPVPDSSTGDLGWNPAEMLAYVTSLMTLGPGDLVLTGSPGGLHPLRAGDLVAWTVPGIGTLRNRAVAGD